jgi:hypothetical protein
MVGHLQKGVHVVEAGQTPPTDEEVEEHFAEIIEAPIADCGQCGAMGPAMLPFMLCGVSLMRRRVRRF